MFSTVWISTGSCQGNPNSSWFLSVSSDFRPKNEICNLFCYIIYSMEILRKPSWVIDLSHDLSLPSSIPKQTTFAFHSTTIITLWISHRELSGISNLHTWSLSPVSHSKTNDLCLPFYNNNYSMDIIGELSGISNLLTWSLSPPSLPIQKLINPLNLSDNGVGFDSFPDKGRTPHFHTNIKEDFCSPVLQKLMRSQQRGLMSLY
jgi:hypothetical protein